MCNAPVGIIDFIELSDDEPSVRTIRRHAAQIQSLFERGRRQTPYERTQAHKIKKKLRHERPGR